VAAEGDQVALGVGRCSVAVFEGNLRARLDKIAQIDHDLSTGLESTNEPDNDYPGNQCFEDWSNRERLWAAHISQTKDAHPDAVIRALPVLGPSFVHASSAATIGDLTQWIDFGNTHPYSGCTSPNPQHVQQNATASSVSRVLPNSGSSGTALPITDRRVTVDVGADAVLLVVN